MALVFGAGLGVGNLIGGRFADRGLIGALLGTLSFLALVLGAMAVVMPVKALAIVFVALLGGAAFATVAPLQMRVLEKAGAAGQSLASSLNIAAFNLGNALGAWLGGLTIDHAGGLSMVPVTAAAVTAAGFAVALWSVRLDRKGPRSESALCSQPQT